MRACVCVCAYVRRGGGGGGGGGDGGCAVCFALVHGGHGSRVSQWFRVMKLLTMGSAAVSIHDAEMARWMRENGVKTPTAYEAARLRRLSERLMAQKSEGDIEGGVDTWLEIWLDAGARPTWQERKLAHVKVADFFRGDQ